MKLLKFQVLFIRMYIELNFIFLLFIAKDLAAKEKTTFSRLDVDGNSSLMLCLKKKKMTIVDAILSSPETNVNVEDPDGDTAATFTLKNDMKDCLNVILARGKGCLEFCIKQ